MFNDPELNAMSILIGALQGLERQAANRVLDWATSKFGVIFEEEESSTEPDSSSENSEPQAVQVSQEQVVPVAPLPSVVPGTVQMVYVPHDQAGSVIQPQVAQIAPMAPVTPVAPAVTPVAPAVTPVAETVVTQVPEPAVAQPAETEEVPQQQAEVQKEDEQPVESKEKTALEKSKQSPTKGLGLKRYKNIENLFLSSNVPTVASRIVLAASFLQEKLQFEEISSYDINSRLKRLGYGVTNITNAINSLLNKKIPLMRQTKKEGETKQSKRKFLVTEEGLIWALTLLKSAEE